MSKWCLLSASEQVAKHLREQLLLGVWNNGIPGANKLAVKLGVNHKTVKAAMRQLEHDGMLVNQGQRCRRQIAVSKGEVPTRQWRVAMLVCEPADLRLNYHVELQYRMMEAGHIAIDPGKCMLELEMDVRRIARLVERTKADAWVVAGGSREVLEWFSSQSLPAFALFGQRRGLPMAGVGPNKPPTYAAATRHLIELGHRRIVLLAQRARRLPEPGESERSFLAVLTEHGIPLGSYHLPDWEDTIDGFFRRLDSLFQVTPPTALIIDEAPLFLGARQYISDRGLNVPGDVSLICTDNAPYFEWCRPSVAHIRWDSQPVVRRIVRWAANVSCGKKDIRQLHTKAEFVPGGTIGPAWKGK